MADKKTIPWQEMYNYVLRCSSQTKLDAFAEEVVSGINAFIRFDQAAVFFMDGNRKVYNQYLVNFDKRFSRLYLDYYSKSMENERYGTKSARWDALPEPEIHVIEWDKEPASDFVNDYIKPLLLRCSLGFALYDSDGMPRTSFGFDKKGEPTFSERERTVVKLLLPMLNNLHRSFFVRSASIQNIWSVWGFSDLTERESQIAGLLCQGLSPANISKVLHISPSTTYKHIEHIYKKTHVSCQRELLALMLGK